MDQNICKTQSARRIAIVVNDLQPYGSQRIAVQLADELANLGHLIRVFTIDSKQRDALILSDGLTRSASVRTRRGALGYVQAVIALRAGLKGFNPDLVISHMVFANVVSLAALQTLRRKPQIVVTEHNIPSRLMSIERSPAGLLFLDRLFYPRADRVIGVSDAVVGDVIRAYRLVSTRAMRVYNPVDVAAIRAGAGGPPHEWLSGDRTVATIVCVGEFRRAKGQDVLLRALAVLPNIRTIFIGGGALLADARVLASELDISDRVIFTGYRSDALSFVKHADLLVVPSRWEGFGLVAVEAAALGTPVVASAVDSLLELVPDHVPGTLVRPDDPGALSAAIAEIVAGKAMPPPHLEVFDPKYAVDAYLNAAAGH